jgi:hypothetical protein
MVIDYCYLMSAVSPVGKNDGFLEHKGWLNRRTGEIVILANGNHDARDRFGIVAAVDMVFKRAEIEANNGEWVEIPKYEGFHKDAIEMGEARKHFALRFLANCNLGNYAVTIVSTINEICAARQSALARQQREWWQLIECGAEVPPNNDNPGCVATAGNA